MKRKQKQKQATKTSNKNKQHERKLTPNNKTQEISHKLYLLWVLTTTFASRFTWTPAKRMLCNQPTIHIHTHVYVALQLCCCCYSCSCIVYRLCCCIARGWFGCKNLKSCYRYPYRIARVCGRIYEVKCGVLYCGVVWSGEKPHKKPKTRFMLATYSTLTVAIKFKNISNKFCQLLSGKSKSIKIHFYLFGFGIPYSHSHSHSHSQSYFNMQKYVIQSQETLE